MVGGGFSVRRIGHSEDRSGILESGAWDRFGLARGGISTDGLDADRFETDGLHAHRLCLGRWR
jgi:hypothetical protein